MQQIIKRDIANIETQRYPIVKPRSTLPSSLMKTFTKPSKPHRKYRHTLKIAMFQCLYGVVAISLAGIAYWWLASQPIYRVVSFAIIVILWSNVASSTARRKTIDMLETIEHPALKVFAKKGNKKQEKALYMESTNVFLKSIKASFVEKKHEIH